MTAAAQQEPLKKHTRAFQLSTQLLFFLATILPCLAIWNLDWLPLQDWPQHLAAIRVLHDYNSSALGFSQWFNLTPLSTQYIGFYYFSSLISYIFEVDTAARLALSIFIVALPYSARSLLKELDEFEWLSLITIPLTFNTFFLLGFANFLAAIPLMLFGLAWALKVQKNATLKTAIPFTIIAFLCFLMHVVPFVLLFMGSSLIFLFKKETLKQKAQKLATLAPPLILCGIWASATDAGGSTLNIAKSAWLKFAYGQNAPKAYFMSGEDSTKQVSTWLLDVVQIPLEEKISHAYFVLLTILMMFTIFDIIKSKDYKHVTARLILLGLAMFCVAMYYFLPTSYDWVWPIAPRFPILALVLATTLLRAPKSMALRGITLTLIMLLSALHTWAIYDSFNKFNKEEVGGFEQAIEKIPQGSKVAGLIFSSGSKYVRFSPFLHSAALLQSKKGGAVMFTFADFPQSPFRFKEDQRPPRVPPRWEWTPNQVIPSESLQWYDYVITRGGPGRIARERQLYTNIYSGPRWTVWQKRQPH